MPFRVSPYEYEENLKYIIHYRNPLDILISQYYSFGYTHPVPDKSKVWYEEFIKKREIIQSQTLDEYCLSQKNIDDINEKYNSLFNWIEKYKHKENVFISDYDDMYYNFEDWLKKIFDFLSLKTYNETLSMFEKEFKNSNEEHIKTDVKDVKRHHRSGLSKQYLIELKKTTIEFVISKLSDNIKNNFDFI